MAKDKLDATGQTTLIHRGEPLEPFMLYAFNLQSRSHKRSARGDSFFYNGGTLAALLASGAATVIATRDPFTASALSAAAAFFIALTRSLNFGGRWRWHLQRHAVYDALIYRLNAASRLSEAEYDAEITRLSAELVKQRKFDDEIPGSGEPVPASTPDGEKTPMPLN
jgi:hypothetical protein